MQILLLIYSSPVVDDAVAKFDQALKRLTDDVLRDPLKVAETVEPGAIEPSGHENTVDVATIRERLGSDIPGDGEEVVAMIDGYIKEIEDCHQQRADRESSALQDAEAVYNDYEKQLDTPEGRSVFAALRRIPTADDIDQTIVRVSAS